MLFGRSDTRICSASRATRSCCSPPGSRVADDGLEQYSAVVYKPAKLWVLILLHPFFHPARPTRPTLRYSGNRVPTDDMLGMHTPSRSAVAMLLPALSVLASALPNVARDSSSSCTRIPEAMAWYANWESTDSPSFSLANMNWTQYTRVSYSFLCVSNHSGYHFSSAHQGHLTCYS